MGHGLYVVTSQGYSWSHSQKDEDDCLRQGFGSVYSGVDVVVRLVGEDLVFSWKKEQFVMKFPQEIREKFTVCFAVYLH